MSSYRMDAGMIALAQPLQELAQNHEVVRSLAQAAGALIAVIAIPIGLILNFRRTKQVKRQNDIAESSQRSAHDRDSTSRSRETYTFAMKDLSSDSIFQRQAAIVLLSEAIGEDHFLSAALAAMGSFLSERSTQEMQNIELKKLDESWMPQDLLQAIQFLRDYGPKDVDPFRRHVVLNRSFLPFARFSGVNLSNCDASMANFSHANFTGANLRALVAENAIFDHARLKSADLTGANLAGSSLRFANLRKVKFASTNLSAADLRDTNMPFVTLSDDRRDEVSALVPEQSWMNQNRYCVISAAEWDPEKPPLVDADVSKFVEQKTRLIRHWIIEDNEKVRFLLK